MNFNRAVTRSIRTSYGTGVLKLGGGTVTPGSASLDVYMQEYSQFRNKFLVLNDFLPGSDGETLALRISTDGQTFLAGASDYDYAMVGLTNGGVSLDDNSVGAALIRISGGIGGNVTEGAESTLYLPNTVGKIRRPRFGFSSNYIDSTDRVCFVSGSGGFLTQGQDTKSVRILFTSGVISSGFWGLYGYA